MLELLEVKRLFHSHVVYSPDTTQIGSHQPTAFWLWRLNQFSVKYFYSVYQLFAMDEVAEIQQKLSQPLTIIDHTVINYQDADLFNEEVTLCWESWTCEEEMFHSASGIVVTSDCNFVWTLCMNIANSVRQAVLSLLLPSWLSGCSDLQDSTRFVYVPAYSSYSDWQPDMKVMTLVCFILELLFSILHWRILQNFKYWWRVNQQLLGSNNIIL